MAGFVPARRRGHEILDDPSVDPEARVRSISDVRRSNRLFGGRRAALNEIERCLGPGRAAMTLLDVGTGAADIPAAIRDHMDRRGARVTILGLDASADLLRSAAENLTFAVCAGATALPFRAASVDVVLCSQVLHHFADGDLGRVIAELNRVARSQVIIADLRRSWIAAAGFWIASFLLRFHPITRHDGVVSVMRGFTAAELRHAVIAIGAEPTVRRHLGFRLTVSWKPTNVS